MKYIDFVILFLFSCDSSYELNIEVESSQKIFFVFNNDTTFPEKSFTKSIDIKNDSFTVGKIKYVPIKKFDTSKSGARINSWGQASVNVKIKKKQYIFSDEILFEKRLDHFYNPDIFNRTNFELAQIQKINPDLNSGLGNSAENNNFLWNDQIPAQQNLIENETNFNHTLILKYGADLSQHKDFENLNSLDSRLLDERTRLFTVNPKLFTVSFPEK
jgi:hypothetical protein